MFSVQLCLVEYKHAIDQCWVCVYTILTITILTIPSLSQLCQHNLVAMAKASSITSAYNIGKHFVQSTTC